ncbi:MAG: hypothetical protein ACT4PY_00200, partial [Armatimonadota bacterium]
AARAEYRAYMAADRRRYRGRLAAHGIHLTWPQSVVGRVATFLGRPGPRRWFFSHYLGVFTGATAAVASGALRSPRSPAIAREHTQS